MQNVPERAPAPDPMTAFRVEQANKLLADIAALDYDDERRPYFLLGTAEAVVKSLLTLIERAGR